MISKSWVLMICLWPKFADGKFWLEKTGLLAFAHGHYFSLGRNLGSFGFSVNKKRLALMQKMEKVDVMVKERKAIILEKRAEAEERPLPHKSKFAKHKKTAISAPHAQKFDGKAKFNKSLTAKQNLKNIFRRTDKLRLRIFISLKNILSNLKKLKKTYLQIEKASLFL